MGSARLLLGSVLLATLIAAGVVGALAGFAAQALPQAEVADLAAAPQTSILISGAFGGRQANIDDGAIATAIRHGFGGLPVRGADALWSDPIGLPAPARTGLVPLVQAAAMTGIRTHAALVAGSWPAAAPPGRPVQAVAPASVAAVLQLRLGQVMTLRDRVTHHQVRFVLTGLYRPLSPAAGYWRLDSIPVSGIGVTTGFVTYGPLLVPPASFSGQGLAVGGATWLETPVLRRIGSADLGLLARRVAGMVGGLVSDPGLGGLQAATGLPAALAGVRAKLVVARSLLAVGELELLLLTGAALALATRTLAGQREDEIAVLTARGAGKGQVLRLALTEATLVTAIGAGIGVLVGSRLAAALASTGTLRSARLRIGGVPADVWWALAAVAVLCVVTMVWPAMRTLSPGATRVRKGRMAVVSAAARAGADVALVGLAALAGWQLHRYSLLGRAGAGVGIDPVLVAAPAIMLAAATVLPLRVLPALARAADRLAARTRRLGAALTSWELSRRVTRQAGPMLLVVLAVGTGTLVLAQYQTWRQSAQDQASFAAGAEVRVGVPVPVSAGVTGTITHGTGVAAATAVSTGLASPAGGAVLAMDAHSAARTVLMRADESSAPVTALWRRLLPSRPAGLLTLPGRPDRLRLVVSLAGGSGPPLGPAGVTVSVQDATGAVYAVPAGVLPGDGRPHALIADLSARRLASYPLRLLAVSVRYALPAPPPRPGARRAGGRTAVLTVRDIAVSERPAGRFGAGLAAAPALRRWRPAVSAPGLAVPSAFGQAPRLGTLSGARPAAVTFHPGDGEVAGHGGTTEPVQGLVSLTAPVPFTVIPGFATRSFLHGSQLHVGDLIQVTTGTSAVTVRIVAAVTAFPTAGSGGALVIDQGAAQDVLAAAAAAPLPVSQWWLATPAGRVPADLPAGSQVTTRARILAGLLSDPMSAIPQQAARSIAAAVALLAIIGLAVSLAGSVRERRAESALLSAMGVGAAAQARLLCVEALALSLPAAATGLLLGVILAHLLLPAITLTAAAAIPVPPVIVRVPVLAVVALATVIGVLPVLMAAVTALRRPDAAAALRAAEAA